MDLGLRGCTAIVCGASSGIGLASAEALAAEAAHVVLFSNEEGPLSEVAERLGATAVCGDLREPADRHRLIETAIRVGGGIDVVVLNGGGPPVGDARNMGSEELRDALELLFVPMLDLVGRSLPYLVESGRGRIIAVTSSAVREPIPGLALSNAIRPGLVGWLKTLAWEVAGTAVTVNAVAPGRIESRTFAEFYAERNIEEDVAQIPAKRWGRPAEVGCVICFLASEQASYLTGAIIPVDGGLSRCLL
jgi:3-oxoacyl-[acyl-carrier protein] reductase